MLKTLSIWNFALIEHIQIEFGKGLNILTGETGAGKSILLGALGMVIGHRVSSDAIRSGCSFMRAEAVFSLDEQSPVWSFLDDSGILHEDDELIIARQITVSGRNTIQINGCHATTSLLRQLGELLVDIHGQHANQALLKPDRQLEIVDEYDKSDIAAQKEKYLVDYETWLALKHKLAKSRVNTQEMAQRQDMLNWQIKEIESAKLSIGEDEKLETEIKVLANAEKISLLTQDAYRLLYESDSASSVLSSLAQVRRDMESLAHYNDKMAAVQKAVDEAYFQLQDSADEIRSYGESIDYSPQKLDAMQLRLDEIDKLRRKYGSSIAEILSYCEKAKQELDYIENYDSNIEQMEQELSIAKEKLIKQADALHELRCLSGEKLSRDITSELHSLAMENARLTVRPRRTETFTPEGNDEIEMMFSANLGEDLRELSKIVSGGELSRIALSLKTLTARHDHIGAMVFDEVDTGVGGKTAQMMAEKIARISRCCQVICITHLPQIAAMADTHFYINKQVRGNKTFTGIEQIDYGARLAEIARMASGTEPTQASLENAEEMLDNARRKKDLLSV